MRIGLPAALGMLFITLKLTDVIAWSWLWVLAPFWAPLGVFAIYLLLVLLFIVVVQPRIA